MGKQTHKLKAKVNAGVFDYQQKIVPPLAYLLMQSSMEELFGFLQKMHMQWTLNVGSKGKYTMRIFKWKVTEQGADREQEFNFVGVNEHSAKAALCNALARFLMYCKDDFHDFICDDWPDILAAKETQKRHSKSEAIMKAHPELYISGEDAPSVIK